MQQINFLCKFLPTVHITNMITVILLLSFWATTATSIDKTNKLLNIAIRKNWFAFNCSYKKVFFDVLCDIFECTKAWLRIFEVWIHQLLFKRWIIISTLLFTLLRILNPIVLIKRFNSWLSKLERNVRSQNPSRNICKHCPKSSKERKIVINGLGQTLNFWSLLGLLHNNSIKWLRRITSIEGLVNDVFIRVDICLNLWGRKQFGSNKIMTFLKNFLCNLNSCMTF